MRVSGSEAIRWDGGDTGHSPLPPTPPPPGIVPRPAAWAPEGWVLEKQVTFLAWTKADDDDEEGRAGTCAGGAVFQLGRLPRLFHPGEYLFGEGGVGARTALGGAAFAGPTPITAVASGTGRCGAGRGRAGWGGQGLRGQAGPHAAAVELLALGMRGGIAQGLQRAGRALVVALQVRGGLEGGLGGHVVAEAIAARVRGIASEECRRCVVVVGGFLHRWARPGRWVATCKGLRPSRPYIGTPGGHVVHRTPLSLCPPPPRVCSPRLTCGVREETRGRRGPGRRIHLQN